MAMIKCKMCGGELILIEGSSTAECEYCGSVQTVPVADDEKKLLQFQRAEKLRRQCDFDKAAGVYEAIVADFPEEAEAYWGLVLCKFGIEYVDDPATGKKIPTCHRSSFDSVLTDGNFEQAMENADLTAQRVYRQEGKEFERLRKQILEVSSTEQPYDIFICYKETDEKGDRTLDSVLAQDLYSALTDKGYRVFFSRITLQGKLGEAYEPYIFAALNSAKVMLAVGSRYEYYNAVWVKNEWSRFLKLMVANKDKHLIPCYRDLDPEDMPVEFNHLQGADLSKMGAVQDILFNMEKYIPLKKETGTVIRERVVVGGDSKVDSMLDRGNMALEDGDWAKADSFFEDVLNLDSKNAQAYLGKLLAQEKCRTIDAFLRKRKDAARTAKTEKCYIHQDKAHITQMAKKLEIPGYLSVEGIEKLYTFDLGYLSCLSDRRQQIRSEQIFWETHKLLSRAEKFAAGAVAEKLTAAKRSLFAVLEEQVEKEETEEALAVEQLTARYKEFLQQADKKAQALHAKNLALREADYEALQQVAQTASMPGPLTDAVRKYGKLGSFRDAKALLEQCRQKAAALQAELDAQAKQREEAERKAKAAKKKKMLVLGCAAAVLVLLAIFLWETVFVPMQNYHTGEQLMEKGEYNRAIIVFAELGDYKDSAEKIRECVNRLDGAEKAERYLEALGYLTNGYYETALPMFEKLGDYGDSPQQAEKCRTGIKEQEYTAAKELLEEAKYEKAIAAFEALEEFRDSKELATKLSEQLGVVTEIEGLLGLNLDMHAWDTLLQSLPQGDDLLVYPEKVAQWRRWVEMYMPYCGAFKIVSGKRAVPEACYDYGARTELKELMTADCDLVLILHMYETDGKEYVSVQGVFKEKDGTIMTQAVNFKTELGTDNFKRGAGSVGGFTLSVNEDGNIVMEHAKTSGGKTTSLGKCVFEKIDT